VFRTSLDRNFPVLVVKNVNISLFLIKLHIWRRAGEWMYSSIINFGNRRRWAFGFTPLLRYAWRKFVILYFFKKSLLRCFPTALQYAHIKYSYRSSLNKYKRSKEWSLGFMWWRL
jgi:hypothetical protein